MRTGIAADGMAGAEREAQLLSEHSNMRRWTDSNRAKPLVGASRRRVESC
jgi:hypothetical protein